MLSRSVYAIASLVPLLLCSLVFAAPVEVPEISVSNIKRSISSSPAIAANFPDPAIIKVDSEWYAFATRTIGASIHIQVASSPDFVTWTVQSMDALPTIPAWVDQSSWNTWAPDVRQLDDGSFVMYFAASDATQTAKHCVGAATASNVTGPYTAQSTPFACPLSSGGAIDASGFRDHDGQRYVVYKVDGNSIGHGGACGNTVSPIVATPLMLQPVASDGITITGSAVQLLNNNGAADQGIIEAPDLIRTRSGTYVLFFSSGCFVTSSYTVSYATASSLTGPYTRASSPLLATGDGHGLTSPGGMTVWSDNQKMVFHANNPNGGGRVMYTAEISISGTTVSI